MKINNCNGKLVRVGSLCGGQVFSDEGFVYMKLAPHQPDISRSVRLDVGLFAETDNVDKLVWHLDNASLNLD